MSVPCCKHLGYFQPSIRTAHSPRASRAGPSPGKAATDPSTRETLQAVADFSRSSFLSISDRNRPDFEVNTTVVAASISDLVASGGLNLKNFAAALRVNKNYLSGLFKAPVAWSDATKLQRIIFYTARNVLKQKFQELAPSPSPMRMPTTSTTTTAIMTTTTPGPRSASSSPTPAKLRRERLSEFQFNYLKDFFQVCILS